MVVIGDDRRPCGIRAGRSRPLPLGCRPVRARQPIRRPAPVRRHWIVVLRLYEKGSSSRTTSTGCRRTAASASSPHSLQPASRSREARNHRGPTGVRVRLKNGGKAPAFLVHLRVSRVGKEILPSFWSDDFLTLLPASRGTSPGDLSKRSRLGSHCGSRSRAGCSWPTRGSKIDKAVRDTSAGPGGPTDHTKNRRSSPSRPGAV